MAKRILVSVSNDVSTDQRVRKQCMSLHYAGYEVLLIGANKFNRVPDTLPYDLILLPLIFNRGFLFYAEWNFRLFLNLLFRRGDMIWANDLDTLLAAGLVGFIKSKPIIYDSHELFTEVPEIQNRPLVKKIWSSVERTFIGTCSLVMTVNSSIANALCEMYKLKSVEVMPNVPVLRNSIEAYAKAEIGVLSEDFLMIYQGSGINVDRGVEELVEAMSQTSGIVLLIVGSGDVLDQVKNRVVELGLEKKVIFKPKVPYEELTKYTAAADLGLSFDKPCNLNYRFSLPNKIFDYAAQAVPVLVSDLPEVRRIVEKYEIGEICLSHDPQHIANVIMEISTKSEKLKEYGENGRRMLEEMNWESLFSPILQKLESIGS